MLDRESGKKTSSLLNEFMAEVERDGAERVRLIHSLAKKVWRDLHMTPEGLQNRCKQAWDDLGAELGTRIKPLVPVQADRPVSNLIFGSGGFSTGEFQAAQYRVVSSYAPDPPVILQGLVTNRSEAHGCGAVRVSTKYDIPLIELDFVDWYHEFVDGKEEKPIRATRYWFTRNDPNRPSASKLSRRFSIRQGQFHADLGEKIAESTSDPTEIASARGYNFQLCSSIFRHQEPKPHANDTHPADLTFIDLNTREKSYPGWQAAPIKKMLSDGHVTFRGSLIEVDYMDEIAQIDELDEGALLAIGKGVTPNPSAPMKAKEIQNAIKLVDDYVFCTLEPAGLLLAWGISEDPLPVAFQDIHGGSLSLKQRLVVVGDKIHSGIYAWGRDLKEDLHELENFLFS